MRMGEEYCGLETAGEGIHPRRAFLCMAGKFAGRDRSNVCTREASGWPERPGAFLTF